MLGLTLTVVLAGTDGGVIYDACPEAPPTVSLDGGWKLMSPERASRLACIIETCEVDRKLARERAVGLQPTWWWLLASGLAVAAFLAGWLVPRPW
jgi:hypothetical protein